MKEIKLGNEEIILTRSRTDLGFAEDGRFATCKKRLSNLNTICYAIRDFSLDAGIKYSRPFLDNETIILESGHQPNFLPHSGLWKKLFLLNFIRKKLYEKGKKVITLFGFADYNLCTAKLLTQNNLPAFNKFGFDKIGFKISEEDRWKRFDYLEKPNEKDWKKEVGRIVSHYRRYSISQDMEFNMIELIEILEECYTLAKKFPDMNAFFISKMSNDLLGLNINFFRYSDLQRKRIFSEEWERIIHNLESYNSIYNNSVKNLGLDMPLRPYNYLPFWYHCSCGAKVNLLLRGCYATGRCRICSKEHVIEMEKENFVDMSPNAIARNIIFSEGMGTDVFVSGSGGGLRYGKISDDISRNLGFNIPVTIAWKSRDYYIGPAHSAIIGELGIICKIKKENIGKEDIDKIIKDEKARLVEMLAKSRGCEERNETKKYEGQYMNLKRLIVTIDAICKTVPSFIDILISYGTEHVIDRWESALRDIEDKQIIVKDVTYNDGDVMNICKLDWR